MKASAASRCESSELNSCSKPSFGQCLQSPGDSSEKMLPMPGPRLFLKHLAILLAQSRQRRPAQLLDFHQYRTVHSFRFLSMTVNHRHMNALCGAKGKSKIKRNSLALSRRLSEEYRSGGRRRARRKQTMKRKTSKREK